MDTEISTLRDTIASSKLREKELKLTLSTLSSTLTTTELRDKIAGLETEKVELEGRLEVFRKGGVRLVEKAEKERVEREWKVWRRNVGVRRGFVREMWGLCSEVLPEGVGSKEELWVSCLFWSWAG